MIRHRRIENLLGFGACAAMMAYALYAQLVLLLEPCPLCRLQRLAVIAIGILFLVAALLPPRRWLQVVATTCLVVVAGLGAGVAPGGMNAKGAPQWARRWLDV